MDHVVLRNDSRYPLAQFCAFFSFLCTVSLGDTSTSSSLIHHSDKSRSKSPTERAHVGEQKMQRVDALPTVLLEYALTFVHHEELLVAELVCHAFHATILSRGTALSG
jgi:hypothetical protein